MRRRAVYRKGPYTEGVSAQDRILRILYGSRCGRLVLRYLTRPQVSYMAGRFMDTKLSGFLVKPFIQNNHIDMSECQKHKFDSYNDFFKRKLYEDARPLDNTENGFISPCDGRLTVFDIRDTDGTGFNIKDSEYTVESLLRDPELAERYRGGKLWLFRLCVDDYHRYIYNVSGMQSRVRRIQGIYHTVNPIAGEYYHIYKENTREYCLIKTKDMGTVLVMEVGAMLVGKIENRHRKRCNVRKGEEKGNFAFGGSTIILITQKDTVVPLEKLTNNSEKGIETRVIQGELVGRVQ